MTAKDLKNALLQEAVQGKLVPQIASEGNARDLLEEIRKEKSKLIKEGKIKKDTTKASSSGRALPEITEDEIPFDIPENWCWCKLGELCEIARGGSPRPIKDFLTTDENGYNWIKIGDTEKDGKYINHTEERIIKEGLKKTRLVHKGDFLLTNSMSFGRPYILNIDGCIHDGWLVISPQNNVFDKNFLYYILSSAFAYNQFCDSVSGAVVKNLNSDKVRDSLFPLPPLAEQKRIIAAIEKFMPLIEEYGKKETELKDLNEQIGTLTKKAILQEAVQGKLVPQISAEGNAKELLEKIKKEKAKLIKEGKIKKEKTLPEITKDEIPFDIPESWCWCRLGEISTFNGGYAFKSENYVSQTNGVRVLRISDFDENGIKEKNSVYYPYNSEMENYKLSVNDIIMCMTGGTVGKSYLVKILNEKMYVNQRVADIKGSSLVDIYYIYSVILSHHIQLSIQENKNSTNDNISAELIKKFLIPLPPPAEQKRIVTAIEKMLPLCEKLGE